MYLYPRVSHSTLPERGLSSHGNHTHLSKHACTFIFTSGAAHQSAHASLTGLRSNQSGCRYKALELKTERNEKKSENFIKVKEYEPTCAAKCLRKRDSVRVVKK